MREQRPARCVGVEDDAVAIDAQDGARALAGEGREALDLALLAPALRDVPRHADKPYLRAPFIAEGLDQQLGPDR